MERGEELMELNREAAERNRAAFDRNTEAFERHREASDRAMAALGRYEQRLDEQTLFIREMNVRNSKVTERMLRDHSEFMAKLLARDEEADRKTDKILAGLDEAREESKAHREALLALIDRLPPPAQAA